MVQLIRFERNYHFLQSVCLIVLELCTHVLVYFIKDHVQSSLRLLRIICGVKLSDLIKKNSGIFREHLYKLHVGEVVDAILRLIVQADVEGLNKHVLGLPMSGATIDKILVLIPGTSQSLIRILLKPEQLRP